MRGMCYEQKLYRYMMAGLLMKYRQRSFGNDWDRVLSNYGKVFLINMIVDGPVGIIA